MEILCVGQATVDLNLFVPEFPVENSKMEISRMVQGGGGPAANAAWLLAMWGRKTGLAAQVGDDIFGKELEKNLKEADYLDLTFFRRQPQHVTPLSVLLIHDANASRTIINRKKPAPFRLDPNTLAQARPGFALFDGHELEASLQVLEIFPELISILDAGSVRPGTLELSRKVDYLVASQRFAAQALEVSIESIAAQPGDSVRRLHQRFGRRTAITLGELGVVAVEEGQTIHFPAHDVAAVDTSGAGDIFHGAFADQLMAGGTFQEALRWGNAAAAISVTRPGSRSSIPTRQEVEAFLIASPLKCNPA